MAEEDEGGDAADGGVESFACADRPLPATVTLLEWCPVVDLLALVCTDEALVLYRYMKWQRIWSVHYDRPITSLAWKPDDGKVLCAGDDAGVVRLFDAETGALLFTAPALIASIASLSWIRESTPVVASPAVSPSLSSFIPSLPPPPSSETDGSFERRAAQVPSGSVAKSGTLDFLTSVDTNGNIVLSFIAAQVSLTEILQAHKVSAAHAARVSLSSDLRLLSVVVESRDSGAAALLLLDSSLLHTRRQELRELANQSANVNLLLSRLRSVLFPARTTWTDVMTQYRSRLQAAKDLFAAGHTSGKPPLFEDSLFVALYAGHISPGLVQAFGHALSELHVKKLGKAIDSALTVLLQALLSQVLPCAELLLFRLSELLALSQCANRFSGIGFLDAPVNAALKAARQVLLRAEELLEQTQQVKLNFHDFFDFLSASTTRANGAALRAEHMLSDTAFNRVAALLSGDLTLDPLGSAFDDSGTSLLVLFRNAEELCNAALRNPSLVISRSITLSSAVPLLQTPTRGLPPIFSFRQMQRGTESIQLLTFTKGRQANETVSDVWVLSYSAQSPVSVARLIPNGEISTALLYDNEHLAVLRAATNPTLSLFEIPATAFAPLGSDPRPITDRDLQAHPVLPAKQRPLELPCAPGGLAVIAPPRGLGALVCETRVLLFDFAIPPEDEEGEEDE